MEEEIRLLKEENARLKHELEAYKRADQSKVDVAKAIDDYQTICVPAGLTAPRAITQKRKQAIKARLHEHGQEAWTEACIRISRSTFCKGGNNRGWTADIDFLCQPGSFVKALEGAYDDKVSKLPVQPKQRTVFDAIDDLVGNMDYGRKTISLNDGEYHQTAFHSLTASKGY